MIKFFNIKQIYKNLGSKAIMSWSIPHMKPRFKLQTRKPIFFMESSSNMVYELDFLIPYDSEEDKGGEMYESPIIKMLNNAGIVTNLSFDHYYGFTVSFDKLIPLDQILSIFSANKSENFEDTGLYNIQFDNINWDGCDEDTFDCHVKNYSEEVQDYFGYVYQFEAKQV